MAISRFNKVKNVLLYRWRPVYKRIYGYSELSVPMRFRIGIVLFVLVGGFRCCCCCGDGDYLGWNNSTLVALQSILGSQSGTTTIRFASAFEHTKELLLFKWFYGEILKHFEGFPIQIGRITPSQGENVVINVIFTDSFYSFL